jgi:hypothetical protein
MIRSDAQTSKAPFILPAKETSEAAGVVATCQRFVASGAPQRLSVEALLTLRRGLEG